MENGERCLLLDQNPCDLQQNWVQTLDLTLLDGLQILQYFNVVQSPYQNENNHSNQL